MPDVKRFKNKKKWMQKCIHQTLHKEHKPLDQSQAICLNRWRSRKAISNIINSFLNKSDRIISANVKEDLANAESQDNTSVFLGGLCDDRSWRDQLKQEFGKQLCFIDPYDPDWDPASNIYDELTGLMKADNVIFYKGGDGYNKEKEFMDQVGKEYADFDDMDKLKMHLKGLIAADKSIVWIKPNFSKEADEYFDNRYTKTYLAGIGVNFPTKESLYAFLSKGSFKDMTREELLASEHDNLTLNPEEFESDLQSSEYAASYRSMESTLKESGSIKLEAPILIKAHGKYYGFSGKRRTNLAFNNGLPARFWVVYANYAKQAAIKKGGYETPSVEDRPPRSFQVKSGQLTSGPFISPQFESLQIRSGLLYDNILSCAYKKQEIIKEASYPKHPDSVVIDRNSLLAGKTPITEVDIWNYYDGVKKKMLPELKGKNLFVGIRLKGQRGKPLYIRHPFDRKTEFIRINNEKDFMETVTGRTVEIHQTMGSSCSCWVIDFDGIPGDNFEKTKKVTAEISDKLEKASNIRKVQIRYTGKRSFHVLGFLKKSQPIDKARDDLKGWLKENFGDHEDVVLSESAQGKRGALGHSPMKINAGQIALWSLRVTGLCCVEVPRAQLMGFDRSDATIDKVYKKLTGKTFVWNNKTEQKKTAARIISRFLARD